MHVLSVIIGYTQYFTDLLSDSKMKFLLSLVFSCVSFNEKCFIEYGALWILLVRHQIDDRKRERPESFSVP